MVHEFANHDRSNPRAAVGGSQRRRDHRIELPRSVWPATERFVHQGRPKLHGIYKRLGIVQHIGDHQEKAFAYDGVEAEIEIGLVQDMVTPGGDRCSLRKNEFIQIRRRVAEKPAAHVNLGAG